MASIDVAMESTCQEILTRTRWQTSDIILKSAGNTSFKWNTAVKLVNISGSGYLLGAKLSCFKQTSDSNAYIKVTIDGKDVLGFNFTGTTNGGSCNLNIICPDILLGEYLPSAAPNASHMNMYYYQLYENNYGSLFQTASSIERLFVTKTGIRFNSSLVVTIYNADASKTGNITSVPNYVTYCLDD